MARPKAETVSARADKAWDNMRQWEHVLRDAYDLVMPQRQMMQGHTRGQQHMDRAYDSTAITAVSKFASRLQTEVTPPFTRFAQLQPGPAVPDEMKEAVRQEAERIDDVVWSVLFGSNLQSALGEAFHDYALGTCAILPNPGPDDEQPVVFVTAPMSQIALERGAYGQVAGVYREFKLRVDEIEQMWADFDVTIPETMRQQVEGSKDGRGPEFKICEATYEQRDGRERRWYYDVLWQDSGTSQNETVERLAEATYDRMPWVTPRWQTLPGEVIGRGPVMEALPDIRTINKIVELELRNAALSIMGVYTGVQDGVLNPHTVRITPGAVIGVASNGGSRGPSLQPLQRSGDTQIAELMYEKLRQSIQILLFDEDLPPQAGPVRSPTEIMQRVQQLQRRIGGPFTRIHSELIVPLYQRVLDILTDRDMIPYPVRIDGRAIQVQVTSPMARQQDAHEIEAVMNLLQILAQIDPQLVQLAVKVEDLGEWLADKLGVDSDIMRERAEREQMQQQIGEQARRQREGPPPAQPGADTIPGGQGGQPVPVQQAA